MPRKVSNCLSFIKCINISNRFLGDILYMPKNNYVKQHVVPRRYLMRFAEHNENNDGYHIGVYRKCDTKGCSYIQNIDKIAYIKNYYDVTTRNDPKYWEHFFASNIEPGYGRGIDNIISRSVLTRCENKVFDLQTKNILSRLIMFQYMRVPIFFDKRIYEGMILGRDLYDRLFSAYCDKISNTQYEIISSYLLNKSGIKDLAMEAMTDEERINKYSEILCSKKWIFVTNKSSIPFITSDSPVILYNLTSKSTRFENGIILNDTIIYYPISSRYLIQIYSWNLDMDKGNEHVVIDDDNVKYVLFVNHLQYQNADKQIFFLPSFQSDFEELLKEIYVK